jgi:hypothetical protein
VQRGNRYPFDAPREIRAVGLHRNPTCAALSPIFNNVTSAATSRASRQVRIAVASSVRLNSGGWFVELSRGVWGINQVVSPQAAQGQTMTKAARGLLISIAVLAVVIGFLAWYRIHFAMNPVEGFTVNKPSSEQRLLIATQGSAFKDAVVAGIVEHLRQRPIFIRVIDVSALSDVNDREWDVIVVLHTIEYGKAPVPAQAFVNRAGDAGTVVVLSTSGAGDFKIEGIDAISSASRTTDVSARVDELLGRIETVLAR